MLSQRAPQLCASEPRPPEVLKASYKVPSISISSRPSSGRISTRRPSAMASHGLPYSLIRPSVDQVREYFSTLCGCCGSAPTRSRTLQAVEMADQLAAGNADETRGQPALRHERLRCLARQCTDTPRNLDVLGQVEVMHAGRARRGADYRIAVIRQARD